MRLEPATNNGVPNLLQLQLWTEKSRQFELLVTNTETRNSPLSDLALCSFGCAK